METVQSTQPAVQLSETEFKVKSEGYGWRKSIHKGWIQNYYHQFPDPNGWPIEAEIFLQKVGDCSPSNRVRVCAVSRHGDVEAEHFLNPVEDMAITDVLFDLAAYSDHNVMFDPVPWKRGVRSNRTRLGFKTVVGEHPFDYFPIPTMFWGIGTSAFQFLSPLPFAMEVAAMTEMLEGSGLSRADRIDLSTDELLYVPGSIIRRPGLPPFTAEVLFDAFSEVEVDGDDRMWTKY
jgi:hypothetical protein